MKEKNLKSVVSSSKESSNNVSLEAALKAIPYSSELTLSKKSIQSIAHQVGEMTTVKTNANKKN